MVWVLILWVISYIVALGLARERNMWPWIVAYWSVLSLKNLLEFTGVS